MERRVLSPWAAVLTVVVAFGASQIGSGVALVGLAFTLGLRAGLKPEELAREHVLQRYLATPLVVFAAIAVSQVTLAVASLGAARLAKLPLRTSMGLQRPRALQVVLAVLLVLATGPLADALAVTVQRAFPRATIGTLDMIAGAVRGQGVAPVLVALAVTFAPAVAEELLFRGLLQPALIKRLGPAFGIGLASLIFGAIHVDPPQATGAALIGLVLGFVSYRSGSLWPAMAAHAANNGLSVLFARYGEPGSVATAELDWAWIGGGSVLAVVLTWAFMRTSAASAHAPR
jgi:membrane protease YdiL (CAAX protease family)